MLSAVQALFGTVFGAIYDPGTLRRLVITNDGNTATPQNIPIKLQVDACTEAMRQEEGYSSTDVSLIILQAGVAGGAPKTTDQVWHSDGRKFKCSPTVTSDPVNSYWQIRGVLIP